MNESFSTDPTGSPVAMTRDWLAEAGFYFDLHRLHVLEPEVTQKTLELREECQEFVKKNSHFLKVVGSFIKIVDDLAKEVETEKIKAITARNLLKLVIKQREARRQQLQALVAERRTQLQRCETEYKSLSKVELEQNKLIEESIRGSD